MRVHKSVFTLSAAHFFIDAYSSMLGAFLPFLHQELNLSLTQAGVLGSALIFSSALMQPLYGYLADQMGSRLFVALGPAIAGVFICSMGMAPDFYTLVLLVVLGGVGIAAFHPQGAAVTAQVSSHGHYQMSVFITGGMMGYAMGPLYITTIITLAGLERSYWAALPGVLMTIYLLLFGPSPQKARASSEQTPLSACLREKRRPLTLLYFLVVVRSIIQIVFVAFLPLYLAMRGYGEAQAGQLLTLFLLMGGVSGFLGGLLADRFGGKTIIVISMLGYSPLLLGFLSTSGPFSIFLCVLGGGFLLLTNPVNVVMGQRLVPQHASTISALMMGFGWGVSGLFLPLVGVLSETYSLQTSLTWLVLAMSPGFLLALGLPSEPCQTPDKSDQSSVEIATFPASTEL